MICAASAERLLDAIRRRCQEVSRKTHDPVGNQPRHVGFLAFQKLSPSMAGAARKCAARIILHAEFDQAFAQSIQADRVMRRTSVGVNGPATSGVLVPGFTSRRTTLFGRRDSEPLIRACLFQARSACGGELGVDCVFWQRET